MKDKDEYLRQAREKFEADKKGSPKKKRDVAPADPNAPKLPKVTKKELNLLKSLSQEEKEAFKKSVEDDEAMLEGINRIISEKIANFEVQSIEKKELQEIKAFNNPPQMVLNLVSMI